MTPILYIAIYASALCFIAGCVRRIRQYGSLPVHLRWELYPVPHEKPERVKHGGSYFEESDWWTKPRSSNRIGELRVMMGEMLLLRSVWEGNRKLWWRSLLFHGGMYCFVAAAVIHILGFLARTLSSGSWPRHLHTAAGAIGAYGLFFMIIGTLALLWRRLFTAEMRDYTHVADYLHLLAIGCASILIFAGRLDPTAPRFIRLLGGAVRFDTTLRVPGLLAVGILLASAILAYVPYSQMAHFIGKYFAFHSVRWDDKPNRDGVFETQLAQSLAFRPTWSARHIQGDGQKSWAYVASENPTAEMRK